MTNNDVLRSVRYMLDVGDQTVAATVRLGGGSASVEEVTAFLKHETEPGYRECPDDVVDRFLDGLIIERRGPADPAKSPPPKLRMSNNTVLKKLRVAFELKEDDLVALMTDAGFPVSKPEMNALFRNPSHPNFRACGDQFLRSFLKSLTARVRHKAPRA